MPQSSLSLHVLHPHAAGIDIGATEHFVAVSPEVDAQPVRSFPAFTADLDRLADWLAACAVTSVAMESTGSFWIPLFDLLESRGFEVFLVDPGSLKQVPGRKSDVSDCQWIQYLHSVRLLAPAFRPDHQVVLLRSFVRQRAMLVQQASRQIMHMQHALTLMNIKLQHVVTAEAITATAHKLARIFYTVLRTHTPYADLGVDHYDQTYRARVVQSLSRRAAALGYSLQPTEVP